MKKTLLLQHKRMIVIALAAICIVVFFSVMNRAFFETANIVDIVLRISTLAPIALGIMVVLIVKGIDLSPGTTVGLLGIIITGMIKSGNPLWLGIVAASVCGLVIGVINGLLIARLNMNPFITTLSIMFIGTSIEKVLTQGGLPIYVYGGKSGLSEIYRGHVLGLPLPIVIFVALAIGMHVMLENMTFGRRLYASGDSIKGATNAGINVRRHYGLAYIISSLLVVVSACFVASQVRSGQPMVGQSYLWDAIGAAYISTILSADRRPNVIGTVLGVAFLAILTNGLTMMGLAFYWKTFFRGILILFILLSSSLNSQKGTE